MSQRTLLASLLVLGFSVAFVTGCTRKCPDSTTPTQATEIPLDTDQKNAISSAETQDELDRLRRLSLEDLSKERNPIVSLTQQQQERIRRDFAEYFRTCKLNTFPNFEKSQGGPVQQPSCDPPLPPLGIRLTKGNTTSIIKRDTSTLPICAFDQFYSVPIFGITSDGDLVQLVQMDDMLQVVVEEVCRDDTVTIANTNLRCCERQRTEDVLLVNLDTYTIEVLEIQTSSCSAMYSGK
ncbi:hypothetical protein HOLleu_35415 [Holothuria leucospilota]|uniref:Uncharacterized protein n=1 Tax=Holothuria leucospilota TaxID=206669 RepID=A0A9Q0YML1_HOLLE|nr:hypothetical protein HOLleu_35415 [Holothuria leucospilota]